MNKNASVELVILGIVAVMALAGLVLLFSGMTGKAAEPFCIDTDNGLNFTVKGTVYSLDRPYVDTCVNAHGSEAPSGDGLWEFICKDNKMKKIYYRCPRFCVDAVCRSSKFLQ
jgi:hypothetical protein